MSDLLIILVVLGLLIVVGVMFFNWWQEKKFHSRITKDFKQTKRDVLIEDFQFNSEQLRQDRSTGKTKLEPSQTSAKEPTFSNEKKEPVLDLFSTQLPEDVESLSKFNPQALDNNLDAFDEDESEGYTADESPTLAPAASSTAKQPFSMAVEESLIPPNLHAQIDLIAILYASSPILLSKLASIETDAKAFEEHTYMYGLTTENQWLDIEQAKPETTFTQLAYSMQLADRGGAVSRTTLNRFQHMVETIGLELSAHVEWQGAGDPLNNAVALDQFCIEVDKTVGFHVLANDGASFHATKLRGLVEAQGLTLATNGRFHLNHASIPGLLEFSIKNFQGNDFSVEMLKSSVMHGVTFQLDIPTVKNSPAVFDNMVTIAKSIAKSLDAEIVDDNRKALGDIQLEKIRQQLKMINATMVAKGVIPGSAHALRLFS